MGGPGGGRWRSLLRAEAVEDCLALDVAQLGVGGVLTWTNARGEPVASMGCELDLRDPETPSVILRYTTRTGEAVASVVHLVATRPHFGGLRRWFACPLCGRRVGKLYLPPGEKHTSPVGCASASRTGAVRSPTRWTFLANVCERLKMIPVR